MDRRRDEPQQQGGQNRAPWLVGAGIAAGVAAVAGGLYYLASGSKRPQPPSSQAQEQAVRPSRQTASQLGNSSWISSLANMADRIDPTGSYFGPCPGIARCTVPENPLLNNLNALLEDIYVRYIALKQEDCQLYYGVFCDIFRQMTDKMKQVDPYYKKYSSRKRIAGSHYDGVRIKKPDEYDMDIVIGLPVNFAVDLFKPESSDIVFEANTAGYIQLRMGQQFGKLPYRDGEEWQTNKAAYGWMDEKNYLRRSKFIQWFKSVVARALNEFPLAANGRRQISVGSRQYTIYEVSNQTSPAVTCLIEDPSSGFKLDVDFVPTLKFPETRWPINRNYRSIPRGCFTGDWMVVPKLNKGMGSEHDQERCWRLAMHDQEKKLMYNLNNMKQTVRLMKKLRDSQDMSEIASYYIKTLFLWEITERDDREFWRNNPGCLFKIMVTRFHQAMVNGKIPYFWNKDNNLIGLVPRPVLDRYASVLKNLLDVLDKPAEYKRVAQYLLSTDEFVEYNRKFLHF